MLSKTRERLDRDGYKVTTENQNTFYLRGKTGIVLKGKPDLIAVKNGDGFVVDAKTGQPNESHTVQVMIYMWAVPLALTKYKNVSFSGRVVYADQRVNIEAEDIDSRFIKKLADLINRVGGPELLRRVPSENECKFCKIAATECEERIDLPPKVPVDTDAF
jgi:CRISPR/Cas system-associated exonuclease Cas4 (RecB family)